MRNFLLLICFTFLFVGCAEDKALSMNGKTVYAEAYGVFNEQAKKREDVVYQISPGSVLLSIVGFETIIIPFYIVGYDLYEPVRLKNED